MFNRPSSSELIFECDRCHHKINFHADEGHPVADFGACAKMTRDVGWTTKKVVSFAWEHYCEECSGLPDAERYPVAKQ